VQVRGRNIFLLLVLLPCLAALASCGAVDKIRGPEKGASNDATAWKVKKQDPLSQPIQVGWTSARASYCGFVFNPTQLRSNFIAYVNREPISTDEKAKLVAAYDYTRASVLKSISADPNYCNKDRTTAIQKDLKAYLAGDFAHRAQPAN